jgi:homoserine dehydrogenase
LSTNSDSEIIVLKFGSSVLRTHADLPSAVHEIYRWYRLGFRIMAVVSAIGRATDELLGQARALAPEPEAYATAELLATGERQSAAFLGIALDRSGVPARVLNPREVGLIAAGKPLDSELLSINCERVLQLFIDYPVLVIPGFFGTDLEGRTHVLGRGGSDLTAVVIAQALGASRCRLIKDVDGVYERDPAEEPQSLTPAGRPKRFRALDYGHALQVAARLIQPKAVSFIRQHNTRAEVAACEASYETMVHASRSELEHVTAQPKPLKVLLLGLGTVGFGVYERLLASPENFQVAGALVRDRGKYERMGIPAGLLRSRDDQIVKLRADVVVDALPDPTLSGPLAEHFLSHGVHVVSAGKAFISNCGPKLTELAARSGCHLRYHAAVGGAAPMIEAVQRCSTAGSIASLVAILNGTCNFILDQCGDGVALTDALAEARRLGFAESDVSADLGGEDAARKITILCRQAFGDDGRLGQVQPLDEAIADRASKVAAAGLRLRQVARAAPCGDEVHASVKFELVPKESPLGRLRAEWNALQILMKDGSLHTVTGRGAGRWPTTEAILADLFDLYRQRSQSTVDAMAEPIASVAS